MLIALWVLVVLIAAWAAFVHYKLRRNEDDHVKLMREIATLNNTKANKRRSRKKVTP